MPAFDAWADLYDLLHPVLPGEAEFYVGQALRAQGPVLELGCGTGRLCLPMVMSGATVVGVDDSQPMLDLCADKLAELGEVSGDLELVRADMRELDLGRRFELVLVGYRTLMHALTPGEQLATLQRIHDHLLPGGRLVFSVWAARPSALVGMGPLRREQTIELYDGSLVVHFVSTSVDEAAQLLQETHLVHEVEPGGEVVSTRHLEMTRAWLTPREAEHLVHRAGYEVEAVFGDFDCGWLSAESDEMIWVLRRPEHPTS